MACCKVPIKINAFSGGCATVATSGSSLTATALTGITTQDLVSNMSISNLAYLGLKCVNIACPPTLVVDDQLSNLASFLDAHLTQISSFRDITTGDIATNTTAVRAGLAALIAGCGCCSQ